MVAWSLSVALVAYTAGVCLAALGLVYRWRAAGAGASLAFVAAWASHLTAVVAFGARHGRVPLTNAAEYLLTLGLVVMTLHLALWLFWHIDAATLILPPAAGLAALGARALLPVASAVAPPGAPGWFLIHVTLSTFGMAALIVTLAMSLIYLVQDRRLKSRRALALLDRLPALDRCDQVGFQTLVAGFTLLTLGIGTGVVVNLTRHGRPWMPEAKQIFPLLAWAVLAVVLVARRRLGFRGRRAAYVTIAAVALGLLTAVGMTL